MGEQIIYLSPEEEMTNVRDRLENTKAGRIILVVPSQSQLRSLDVWLLLRSRVRELGQDVRIICPDRQIRNVAKTAGFPVAESLESSPSVRSRPINRTVHRGTAGNSPQGTSKQARSGKKVTRALSPGQQQMLPLTSENRNISSNSGDVNGEFDSAAASSFEIEDNPFEDMKGILPVASSEQRDSTFIQDINQSMAEISDVPTDVYDAEVEDLGDFDMPPLSSLAGNAMQPSTGNLGNKDDLLPPSSQIEDQPSRVTPSATAARHEPRLISKSGRAVSPPLYRRRVGTSGATSRRPSTPLLKILAILIIICIIVGGFAISYTLLARVAYSATATITPASIDLNDNYVITGILGVPDASQRQIQARLLSDTTTSQAKTLKVTGAGHIPATAARGSLTFYNALPYSQAIVAGTVFIDNNNVQVVNDKPAIIPAARPPAEGTVTIPAHAITMGIKGNIPAFAFNDVPCCVAGITIKNQAKFSGGQDQKDYTFVQQSDIDSVVNAEKASLTLHAESVLHAEFFQNEKLINPDKCSSESISDHVAGDRATSVTVSLTVTCTGEVYDQQGAQLIAANLLTSKAMFDLDAGYALVGRIATTIKQIAQNVVKQGTIYLQVSAKGIWAYKFSDASQRMLAKLIAGKKITDAQSLLMHHVGIARADIQVFGIAVNMVPDDPDRIIIVIQSVY